MRRMPPGRPPGRALTELELRHLRLLLDIRASTRQRLAMYDEMLEDFVLDCREAGASARGMAEVLGVNSSTVQTWTKNAARRRNP